MTYFFRPSDYVESSEWDILCAGPSLNDLDPETYKPKGPVIAVNFAATYPVQIEYLCALDPPVCFLDEVLDAIPKSIVVLCQSLHVKKWRAIGFRTWEFPSRECEFRERLIPKRCPGMELAVYTMTSMFPAMGMAIHCGARVLNIYGADMGGVGGFRGLGKHDHKKSEENWNSRWKNQREQLAEIQSWWEIDPGVEFIYHNKPVEVEA